MGPPAARQVGILYPHPLGWILPHRNSRGTSLLLGGPLWHRFGRDAKCHGDMEFRPTGDAVLHRPEFCFCSLNVG